MLRPESLQRIAPQTKVAAATKILDEKRHAGCPLFLLVVDEVDNREEILGLLSVNDVFRKLEPAARPMEELPIFWQGQFHQECQSALERSSGEIMSPVSRAIHQSGTLMEAVHLMNSGGIDWLPVVEGGDVVGILLKDDLFKEVVAVARESG